MADDCGCHGAGARVDALDPGTWMHDPVHFPKPGARSWAELYPESLSRATAACAQFPDMPMNGREPAYVNGFSYEQTQPVAPDELPGWFGYVEEPVREKLWCGQLRGEQLGDAQDHVRLTSITRRRAFQAVDPAALCDDEVGVHLMWCADGHAAAPVLHMSLLGSANVATLQRVAKVGE